MAINQGDGLAASLGNEDAYRQTLEKTYTRNQGTSARVEYAGPKEEILDLLADMQASLASDDDPLGQVVYRYANGEATLTLEYPDDVEDEAGGDWTRDGSGAISDYWELTNTTVYRPIRQHAYFVEAIKADPGVAIEMDEIDRIGAEYEVLDTTSEAVANYWYFVVEQKRSEYQVPAPILRHTRVVSSKSKLAATYGGVGKAHTLESLGVPEALLGTMSGGDFDSTKKQWLQLSPSVRQTDNIRYELVEEYEWARRHSHILYDGDEEDGNP